MMFSLVFSIELSPGSRGRKRVRRIGGESLLDTIGAQALLYGLTVASILGAAFTWFFRIETTGVNLETLHAKTRSSNGREGVDQIEAIK
jgi:hypothetical protein